MIKSDKFIVLKSVLFTIIIFIFLYRINKSSHIKILHVSIVHYWLHQEFIFRTFEH
jgi:uncharacterized membrane protein (DUF106 family)